MRKLWLSFLLITTIAVAKPYTQEDRIKDMQVLAKAMQDIQNGFFYNNYDMIKAGGILVSDTIMKIEPPLSEKEEKDAMTRFMNNKVKMTGKIKKNIKRKMHIMIERFGEGDSMQALQNFTNASKECMKCHAQLRQW
jgi:hypothetical protein